eukprot:2582291-Amphidinium_carterae.4
MAVVVGIWCQVKRMRMASLFSRLGFRIYDNLSFTGEARAESQLPMCPKESGTPKANLSSASTRTHCDSKEVSFSQKAWKQMATFV